MNTKLIAVVALIAFMNYLIGCSSTEQTTVQGSDIENMPAKGESGYDPTQKIISVILLNGEVITFSDRGAFYHEKYFDREKVIVGADKNDEIYVFGIDEVLEAQIQTTHSNVVGTILTTLGVIAAIGLVLVVIALATKKSCPFVYTYDGETWKFDAEPYGGAVSKGLKKTDYSRLEHLEPVDGKYQLMISNEADESQYTDEMKILVVDHPEGTTVAPDYTGTMFAFNRHNRPIEVRDEDGRDLSNFLKANDGIKWQTHLSSEGSTPTRESRHHLTFTFPKSDTAGVVKLLVNAGTALWGSNMIGEMLELRGSEVDRWYADIDAHGPELEKLYYFNDREELYTLKINLLEDSVWVPKTFINGGGPLIDEDRLIDLDVSRVPGNTFTIRLNPPWGFWKIDYIGCIESSFAVTPTADISSSWGEDQDGRDITGSIAREDDSYYSMPRVGDWSRVDFMAPPPRKEGMTRSLYLRTSGYYTLHLPKEGPEQTDFINQLGMVPGKIVDYSRKVFAEWQTTTGAGGSK